MLPLTKPENGYLRLLYSGPVAVSGTSVQQSWDLTELPSEVRSHPNFKNNLLILVKQITPGGVTAVSDAVSFVPASGPPSQLVLTLNSSDSSSEISIDLWCLHSILGACSSAPQLYFISPPSTTPQLFVQFFQSTGGTANADMPFAWQDLCTLEIDVPLNGSLQIQAYVQTNPPDSHAQHEIRILENDAVKNYATQPDSTGAVNLSTGYCASYTPGTHIVTLQWQVQNGGAGKAYILNSVILASLSVQ